MNSVKKAVLIGINYLGSTNELSGCINDILNAREILINNYGFTSDNILVITDDETINSKCSNPKGWDQPRKPTKGIILKSFEWLNKNVAKGSHLYIHYSGHGTYVVDKNRDESDGKDEAICPVDFQSSGIILDDQIRTELAMKVPTGVRLTALFDSCHSGSALDLKYNYAPIVKSKTPTNLIKNSKGYQELFKSNRLLSVLRTPTMISRNNLYNFYSYLSNNVEKPKNSKGVQSEINRGFISKFSMASKAKLIIDGHYSDTSGDVVFISGCTDSQTSADAFEDGKSTGAMTYAFLKVLSDNAFNISYTELIDKMRELLSSKGYTQIPQMSFGKQIDLSRFYV